MIIQKKEILIIKINLVLVSSYKTCFNINSNFIRIKYKYHYFNRNVNVISKFCFCKNNKRIIIINITAINLSAAFPRSTLT